MRSDSNPSVHRGCNDTVPCMMITLYVCLTIDLL